MPNRHSSMRRWLSTRTVEVNLKGRRKVVLFAACMLVTLLAVAILREAAAQTLGNSLRPARIQAGIWLDSNQPALYHRLGMIRFYSTDHPDAADGLKLLRRAVKMQPDAASYWRDLGSACAAAGDTACADRSFQRAVTLNPMTPGLHWIMGNYDLELSRTETAFAEFNRLLVMDPEYCGAVFHLCLQMHFDDQVVWNKIVKGNANFRVALNWMNALVGVGRLDDADHAWHEEMQSLPSRQAIAREVSYTDVEQFVNGLIQPGMGPQAAAVWNDLGRLGLIAARQSASTQANLIFNGRFAQKPLNSGFDWRLNPSPGVIVTREGVGTRGPSSLRIDFTPPRNADVEPVYQYVPVEPGQTYELTARVKSERITSDSGPSLRVTDAFNDARLLASTPAMTGTNTWQRVQVMFITAAKTQFVKVSVCRPRSRAYPFEISGDFWLSSVSLAPVHSMAAALLIATRPESLSTPPENAGGGRP